MITDITALEADATSAWKDNGHALISPSGASTWMECSASVRNVHQNRIKAPDNIASIEGTCAHFLLELCLTNWICPTLIAHIGSGEYGVCPSDELLEDAERWLSRIVNRSTNSDEVIVAGREYYSRVVSVNFDPEMRMEIKKEYDLILEKAQNGWTVLPELRVSLKSFLGHTQCDGISDVPMFKGTELIVADLKYGIAIPVNPVESKQLRIYAAGVVDYIYTRHGVVIDKISLVIMQSRIDNQVWNEWRTTYTDLHKWIMESVKPAAIKALEVIAYPDKVTKGSFNPSADACRWCSDRALCSARREFTLSEVSSAFELAKCNSGTLKPEPFQPTIVSDKELGEILNYAPFILSWFKDAEVEALKRVKQGRDVGGRIMVLGRNKRQWPKLADRALVKKFVELGLSPMDAFIAKVKSPAQIEKSAIPSEVKNEIMKLVINTRGSDIMALTTDSREVVTVESRVRAGFVDTAKKYEDD